MRALKTYCADVGSIAAGRFGWASRSRHGTSGGTSIEELSAAIVRDLDGDEPVALGFECPLFVPFGGSSAKLGCARDGEGTRAWSAQAGAASLATGLVQVTWILNSIRTQLKHPRPAFLDWAAFGEGYRGLFLWEAFVTGEAKGLSHMDDARTAVDAFVDALPELRSSVTCQQAYSLIGAALLRTEWTTDLAVLSQPAVVIRASKREV
jgi:hypothetical protein